MNGVGWWAPRFRIIGRPTQDTALARLTCGDDLNLLTQHIHVQFHEGKCEDLADGVTVGDRRGCTVGKIGMRSKEFSSQGMTRS